MHRLPLFSSDPSFMENHARFSLFYDRVLDRLVFTLATLEYSQTTFNKRFHVCPFLSISVVGEYWIVTGLGHFHIMNEVRVLQRAISTDQS